MQPAKPLAASKSAAFASVISTPRASRSGVTPWVRISSTSSTARRVQTAQWPSSPPTKPSRVAPKRNSVSRSATMLSSLPV